MMSYVHHSKREKERGRSGGAHPRVPQKLRRSCSCARYLCNKHIEVSDFMLWGEAEMQHVLQRKSDKAARRINFVKKTNKQHVSYFHQLHSSQNWSPYRFLTSFHFRTVKLQSTNPVTLLRKIVKRWTAMRCWDLSAVT
jgi:hypothetical protein